MEIGSYQRRSRQVTKIMFFWLIYISTTAIFANALSSLIKTKYKLVFLFIFFALVTPTKVSTQNADYAPALFSFLFNILFQEDLSTRILRPLVFSIPVAFIAVYFLKYFKKIFFRFLNYLDRPIR